MATMPSGYTPQQWAVDMLELMAPASRIKLLRKITVDLRKRQAENIRSQQSPEGTAWQARQTNSRNKRKGKMLKGFSRAKHLKQRVSAVAAEVGFSGTAARLAQIHHYGMVDNVTRDGPKVQYPARQLIGFTPADEQDLDQHLLNHFGNAHV